MNFARASKIVAGIAPAKSTLTAMECTVVKASGGKLEMTATNLDVSVKTTIEWEGPDLLCCVNADRFNKTISAMKAPQVAFSESDNRLVIKDGRAKASVVTMDATMHPGMIDCDASMTTLPGEVLKLIESVAFAQAVSDVRYYLNGVYIHGDGKTLSAVATNGFRLAAASIDSDVQCSAILSGKTVKTIAGLDDPVISVGRVIRAKSDGVEMIAKLIDGKYPDFRRVIPNYYEQFTVKKEDITEAFKRIRLFANEKYPGVKMEWGGGTLKMTAKDDTRGDIEELVDCIETSAGTIAINYQFLEEVAGRIESETIAVQFRSEQDSLRIDDGNTIHVIMPMRC